MKWDEEMKNKILYLITGVVVVSVSLFLVTKSMAAVAKDKMYQREALIKNN